MESAVAHQDADWEPDDVFVTDNDPKPSPAFVDFGMSEEELRSLVSDVVRQELKGDLGERITRNVRKLVRREIQRAFTAQGLE